MKKLFLVSTVLAALLALAFSGVYGQETINTYLPMGGMNDSLTVANTQIYDTSTAINPSQYSYLAAVINVDRKLGGRAGAGYFYFEGCLTPSKLPSAYAASHDTTGYWIRIPFLSVTDSLEVKTSEVMSGYADISYAAILSVMPSTHMKSIGYAARGPIAGGAAVNWLPFKRVRMIISDTNWTAKAVITPYWVVRK